MQAIDQITARLPVRDYQTPKADDGSSSHVLELGYGARFEVIYDREGRPVDFRADRVRFELLAGHIVSMRETTLSTSTTNSAFWPTPNDPAEYQPARNLR